jgi:hypothetical protein
MVSVSLSQSGRSPHSGSGHPEIDDVPPVDKPLAAASGQNLPVLHPA